MGVGGEPAVEVGDVAAGGGGPGDDGVAAAGDAGGDDLGGGDADEGVPDAGADESGMAGAAEQDAAAEHELAVDVDEHEVVAQRHGEVVACGDVRGQRVHAQNQLVDVLELLAGGDVAAFVDADEDVFAAVGGAEVDAEASVAHVEEEGDGAVLERVAADEPGLGSGGAAGGGAFVEGVEGLDGLEDEDVVAGDDFAPVAEPGGGVVGGGAAFGIGPGAGPEGVDHRDEGVGGPGGIDEEAVEAAGIAAFGVEGEHADDETEVVVLLDLAEVDGADRLGAFVVLAVVAEGEEEGDGARLGLRLEVGDDGGVVAGDALFELFARFVAVFAREPHRRGEEGGGGVVRRRLDGAEPEGGLGGEIPESEGLHLAEMVPDERLLVHARHGEGVHAHDGGPSACLENFAHGVVGAALGLLEGDEHGLVGQQLPFLVERAHVFQGDGVVATLGEHAHLLFEHVRGDVGRTRGRRLLDAVVGEGDEGARRAHRRCGGRLEERLADTDLQWLEEGDEEEHDAEEEHPGLDVAVALDGFRALPGFAVLGGGDPAAGSDVVFKFGEGRRGGAAAFRSWRGLPVGFSARQKGVVRRRAPRVVVWLHVVHPRVPHLRPRSVKSAQ